MINDDEAGPPCVSHVNHEARVACFSHALHDQSRRVYVQALVTAHLAAARFALEFGEPLLRRHPPDGVDIRAEIDGVDGF
jgi:hypothetical protein